jgi:endonuclease III
MPAPPAPRCQRRGGLASRPHHARCALAPLMARQTTAQRAAPDTLARLHTIHPDAHCELLHEGPFQLLVAVVLSAQTTDRNVNLATPALFARYPDARSLAAADAADVAPFIASLSFYPTKAKHLVGLARLIVEAHGGEVPRTMAELRALPGVGRKTANVVLGDAFGRSEGVVVDTHVQRLSQRLGWSRETSPELIERDLMQLFPQKEWAQLAHVLIFHGRRICAARAPACATCGVASSCPSAGKAEQIGRKPPKKAPAAELEPSRQGAPGRRKVSTAIATSKVAPTGARASSKPALAETRASSKPALAEARASSKPALAEARASRPRGPERRP